MSEGIKKQRKNKQRGKTYAPQDGRENRCCHCGALCGIQCQAGCLIIKYWCWVLISHSRNMTLTR